MVGFRSRCNLFFAFFVVLQYGNAFQVILQHEQFRNHALTRKRIEHTTVVSMAHAPSDTMKSSCAKRQWRPSRVGSRPTHDDHRRRNLIRMTVSVATTVGAFVSMPVLPVLAATPVTREETDGLKARIERKFRVKVPKMIRPRLNQDFAVLLMRSSYNALDEIDCVGMDQFHRDFFLTRQAEYLPYIEQLGPGIVQQGMLTDPYYFDFISFAQYATISREVHNSPASVFQEQQALGEGADEPQTFEMKVVKRDASITDDLLSIVHGQLVGKAIVDRLNDTFQNTPSSIPSIQTGVLDANSISLALTQLMKLFLVNGFAIDGSVHVLSQDHLEAKFCITLTNPANLWSGKALKQAHASPTNSFLLKAAVELVRRAGLKTVISSVKYEDYEEKSFLTIQC